MDSSLLSIGALADHSKVNIPTIRYYEQIGLIPPARRAANGHRHYEGKDLQRLVFIKRCRNFGFPIEQVKELVQLFEDGDRACLEVRDLAQERLADVRAKLREMRLLESNLAGFVRDCDSACCAGPTRDCTIIDEMAARK